MEEEIKASQSRKRSNWGYHKFNNYAYVKNNRYSGV